MNGRSFTAPARTLSLSSMTSTPRAMSFVTMKPLYQYDDHVLAPDGRVGAARSAAAARLVPERDHRSVPAECCGMPGVGVRVDHRRVVEAPEELRARRIGDVPELVLAQARGRGARDLREDGDVVAGAEVVAESARRTRDPTGSPCRTWARSPAASRSGCAGRGRSTPAPGAPPRASRAPRVRRASVLPQCTRATERRRPARQNTEAQTCGTS